MSTVENVDAWTAKVAEIQAGFNYAICGGRNRELGVCTLQAGKGTDHFGQGRCSFHGGINQSPLADNWKHGRASKVKTSHPQLQAKMEQIEHDHQVFDLEQEVIRLRAIAQILAEQDDLLGSAKISLDVSKIIERLHNIQVGRKYVIEISSVAWMIEAIKDIIIRNIPDEFTRRRIAQEINGLKLGGVQTKQIEPSED